ncbi:imidazole glycerol phosphate synthase cyclase subunit [Thalassospira lucentensis]|uniref:Imidazole glycerol phosphate synthase subunit HisF n=2 Tax=Thalassospira TaxID=168934 RepID=A0A154L8K9_9PROT|nr:MULTISPECIES: imidazole glycerol phosphate synthase cyclase subunit [Thalassospira]KZB66863.1 imidazole glycerol phosphate synthase cyclase subunit [Thalassospira lucentensis]MCH2273502.1 imidazole glycerol phosphate synthase cyclase subunit [Thalassospira sp.]SOC16713.1 cyclase [Thalassospira xiamenensis]
MLKRRIIPIQLLMENRLVKTVQFGTWRDVGDPVKSSAVYNAQYADELIFLNISRSGNSVHQLADLLLKVSEVCFMPLTVGGGIRTFDDAEFLIKNGADKVVINSSSYKDPNLVRRIADRFGTQAVVIGIDARRHESGYKTVSDCGKVQTSVGLQEHIRNCEKAGAGEILIQSIDQDGMMNGYDINLLKLACSTASVPIIGCGGCGQYNHLKQAFLETEVSALACGSLFNFSDSNPMRAKAFLSNYGLNFKVV